MSELLQYAAMLRRLLLSPVWRFEGSMRVELLVFFLCVSTWQSTAAARRDQLQAAGRRWQDQVNAKGSKLGTS
jgi:hypothetical protein